MIFAFYLQTNEQPSHVAMEPDGGVLEPFFLQIGDSKMFLWFPIFLKINPLTGTLNKQ